MTLPAHAAAVLTLTQQLELLRTSPTTSRLKTEYESACELFSGDAAAMFAIRERTFYRKEELEARVAA